MTLLRESLIGISIKVKVKTFGMIITIFCSCLEIAE